MSHDRYLVLKIYIIPFSATIPSVPYKYLQQVYEESFNLLHRFISGNQIRKIKKTYIWRPWTLSIFQEPHSPCLSKSKIFPPVDLGRLISNEPPLQMTTNQLKENIIQWWLLYVVKSFLQVGFRFQYQLINLVWLSFDFFSFSWSLTICSFVALYSCVSSCSKISRDVFY